MSMASFAFVLSAQICSRKSCEQKAEGLCARHHPQGRMNVLRSESGILHSFLRRHRNDSDLEIRVQIMYERVDDGLCKVNARTRVLRIMPALT
jgi:hypothetical protein